MASTIEQIMAELDRSAGYSKDRSILQSRLSALPGQAAAEIQGLDAKKDAAFGSILDGARARGVGFSGIPLGEQAKYSATDYMPAVARVKTAQNEQSAGILSSLNALSRDQRTQAQSIFENNRSYELQKAQFEEAKRQADAARRAASAAAYSPGAGDFLGSLLGGGGAAAAPGVQAQMSQRRGGGFNFNIGGKAVSAAAYAAATKTPIRTLLAQMAKAGDSGARAALGFVGGDGKYDPRKLTAQNANIYNALFWGVNSARAPKSGGGGGGW